MTKYVPFDRDWWAIGFIEPEFITETVGWANEEMLFNADMVRLMVASSDVPVAWIPSGAFTTKPLPEPKPIKRTTLKWAWTD